MADSTAETLSGTFSHLLAPLDGSRLAEAALQAVESLAGHFGSHVTLIHVLEQRPPSTVHGDRHLMDSQDAAAYLEGVAQRMRARGISVETHVHENREGDVARSIAEHADEFAPELIVLCAHGSGGLRGFLSGAIALQVLNRGSRPVLLIQPAADGSAPPFDIKRILVPLDGRHPHESTMECAATLAQSYGAAIHLALVVPTLGTLPKERAATGTLLPGTMRAILDMDQAVGQEFLDRVAGQLRQEGQTVTTEVLRGDAAPEVIRLAQRMDAGLIVMPAHGRAGLDALFSGSVTVRLSARFDRPLLMVRAEGEDAAS